MVAVKGMCSLLAISAVAPRLSSFFQYAGSDGMVAGAAGLGLSHGGFIVKLGIRRA